MSKERENKTAETTASSTALKIDEKPSIVIDSSRVTLPQFYFSNPATWFLQAESQFSLFKITSDATKYCLIISKLPSEIVDSIMEIIETLPENNKYDTVKSAIIKRQSLSDAMRLDRLIEREDLGDRKPSDAYRTMKRLAGESFQQSTILDLWFRRLPANVSAILSAFRDKPIEDLLDIGDRVYESQGSRSNVSEASMPRPAPLRVSRSQVPHNDPLETRLAHVEELLTQMALNSPVNPRHQSRSRSRSGSRFNRNFRSPVRNNSNDVCWYHRKYGSNARRCLLPCSRSSELTTNQQNLEQKN